MKVLGAFLLFVATFVGGLRAQETWGVAASPTVQNLWSIAWGSGLFVAVGENGTIVTSPDGVAWTPRASGTTNWLVGAAYANNQFVVVGDHGTLLTSADGSAWQTRPSGTSERLNAAGYGNERWLAVGENGSAVTSLDGLNWAAVPTNPNGGTYALTGWLHGFYFAYGSFVMTGQRGHIVTTADANFFYDRSVATPANLESVTYARHRFVAVGDNGIVLTSPDAGTWRGSLAPTAFRAITFFNNTFVAAAINGAIFTSPDATTWTARSTGNTAPLTALASNDTTIAAVGFGGVIVRSSATSAAPAIVAPPGSITEAAGNHVRLAVTAAGSAPLSYQWNFAGHPIAGATHDTLALRSITTADAGQYIVSVQNALGAVTSAAATLTVVANFPAPGDLTDPTFKSSIPDTSGSSAVLVQPDGKILYVNGSALTRVLADGSRDPDFTTQLLPGTALALQSDGRILVGGSGSGGAYLVRRNPNGSPDATFILTATLPGTTIGQIIVQPDGKIIVATGASRVMRLNADGSPDSGFVAADLAPYAGAPGATPTITLAALGTDGHITVAGSVFLGSASAGSYVLVARLLANGSLDPAFTPAHTGAHRPVFLSALADGRVLLASESSNDNTGYFGSGEWSIQRLNADGTDDATFLTQEGYIPKYGGEMRAAMDALGRIVVVVSFNNTGQGPTVVRYQPDGTVDATLRGSLSVGAAFHDAVNFLSVQPDGRVLVSRDRDFRRLVVANAPALNPPVALDDDSPPVLHVASGGEVTLPTAVAGSGAFTYSWIGFFPSSYQQPYLPVTDSVTITNLREDSAFYATVSNAVGRVTYPARVVRVIPASPAITAIPATVTAEAGRSAVLSFTAVGSGPLRYQWFFNGHSVNGGDMAPTFTATNSDQARYQTGGLQIDAVTPATAGTYQLVLTSPLGSQVANVNVAIAPGSRLADVSTRSFVDADKTLIAGFVVAGDTPKWVLIRGVGPGLAPFGVANFLADPKLTLFDAAGAKLDENDNWVGTAESYTKSNWPDTFALAVGSRDAIVSRQLPPGNYTVQLSGAGNGSGVALVEVYEGIHESARLINLSSRVFAGSGEQTAITGVVVTGDLPKKLLIRVAGPALTQFGVNGALVDPSLTLIDRTGTAIAGNDNWTTNVQQAELAAASAKVGAFPFAPGSKDAALLVTVPPGSYSVVVNGVNPSTGSGPAATGTALVEVYEVP